MQHEFRWCLSQRTTSLAHRVKLDLKCHCFCGSLGCNRNLRLARSIDLSKAKTRSEERIRAASLLPKVRWDPVHRNGGTDAN